MTRRSSNRTEKTQPVAEKTSEVIKTPEVTETPESEATKESVAPEDVIPLNNTPSTEEATLPPAATPEAIHAQIQQKLSNRSVQENTFSPSNPADLRKLTQQIVKEGGFNRGQEIGARLMARARQRGLQ